VDGLKQRIIGALVLISLAVIFVPMIFDEPHSERQSTPITIPEEPPFPEVDMPAQPDVRNFEEPETDNSGGGYRMIEEPAQADAAVPEAVVEAVPRAAPQAEPRQEPEPQPQPASEPAASPVNAPAASEPEQPREFAKTLEGAWIVQLGSFGNSDNARRLRDKVIEMQYGAHLQQVTRGDTELTRVFSGPFVSEAEARKVKAILDKEFNLNSLVTTGGK
jgi:DedD protein